MSRKITTLILMLLALVVQNQAQPAEAPCAICIVTEGPKPEKVAASEVYKGKTYYFCSAKCREMFLEDPERWVAAGEKVASREGARDFGMMPTWDLTTATGQSIKSTDYAGKVIVIDFWATWCGPCVKEIPLFVDYQKRYQDDLRVLGLSFDQEEAAHSEFLAKNQLGYPSVRVDSKESKRLRKSLEKLVGPISAIPVTLIVDRTGKIVYRQSGVVGPDFEAALMKAIQAR